MLYYSLKVLISAGLIIAISELAKRHALLGAVLASVPLTSVLALCWLELETHNHQQLIRLSNGILWLTLPSLAFFFIFPLVLQANHSFVLALGVGLGGMLVAYALMTLIGRYFGWLV